MGNRIVNVDSTGSKVGKTAFLIAIYSAGKYMGVSPLFAGLNDGIGCANNGYYLSRSVCKCLNLEEVGSGTDWVVWFVLSATIILV
ncbi:MAG: hypothetical protein AAF693_06530 [Bacteroidota bacterium]